MNRNYYENKANKIYNKIKIISETYFEPGYLNVYMKNVETQKQLLKLKKFLEDEIENLQHELDVLNSYFWMIKWNSDSNIEDFEKFKMDFNIDDNLLSRTIQKTSKLNSEISELREIVKKQKTQIEKLYNAFKQIDDSININGDCNEVNINVVKNEAENLLKKLGK